MPTPILVIVTGLPCTGKTTLARQLAAPLCLPLIAKDDIKERLYDTLGWSDREYSRKLGRATFDLMFYFMEIELSAGHSLIVEAPFYPQYQLETFRALQQRHPFHPVVIECLTDPEILQQRFIKRSESGERHPGHRDKTSYAEAEALFFAERMPPFDLGHIYIEINTTDFDQINIAGLVAAIQAEMKA